MKLRTGIRYITWMLAILIVSFIQNSCTEEVPQILENTVFSLEPVSLKLSSNDIKFTTYLESSQSVNVTSTNVEWEFVNVPDWIQISPMRGSKNSNQLVSITCKENPTVKDRMGVFVFRSRGNDWNYSTSVTVSQVRSVYQAVPESDSIVFAWTASQAIVNINANNDEWTVNPQRDLSGWCTVVKKTGAIEINCSENASIVPRSGYLTISTADGSQRVKISQAGVQVGVSVENSDSVKINFSDKASRATIEIKTQAKVAWSATTDDDWITISPTQGRGSATITVSVRENSYGPARTGKIRVQAYDYVQEVIVFQNGKYLEVSSQTLSFDSRGGELVLSLKSNDGWVAESDSEWLLLSEDIGDGDCEILLTVSENNSIYSRSGNITISPNIAAPVILNVAQAGRYLAISDSSSIVFGHGGIAQKTILVNTDGTFDVTTDCEYVTIVKEEDRFTIYMADFNATAPIEGNVYVIMTGLPTGDEVMCKVPFKIYGINKEAVDLGLSVQWATCNVGALQSEEFGDYYAWGEIETYYEPGTAQSGYAEWKDGKYNGYSWYSYRFSKDYSYGSYNLTKYSKDGGYGYDGFSDGKEYLDPEDDVAHVEWGGTWRIPSTEDFEELTNNCRWTWTIQNGIKGYKITSQVTGYTDRSIFLPAAGYYSGTTLYNNTTGYYWTNWTYNDRSARLKYFEASYYYYTSDWERSLGIPIRPVCSIGDSLISKIQLDSEERKLTLNSQIKLNVTGFKKDGNTFSLYGVEWSSSDTTVATVSNGLVTAVGDGTCVITAQYSIFKDECNLTVVDPDMVEPEFVDLGLSVKWATFNVGAYSPEMVGDYFAWGETETYYEPGYAYSSDAVWRNGKEYGYRWSSYSYCNGSQTELTKYCNNGGYGQGGFTDTRTVLEPQDDVAQAKWGWNWRMPTKEEFQELLDYCSFSSTEYNGVRGIQVTSNVSGYTNKSIFLPLTSNRDYTSLYNSDYGRYWSSSLSTDDNPSQAFALYVTPYWGNWLEAASRYFGYVVRPVYAYSTEDIDYIEMNTDKLDLLEGYTSKLSLTGYIGTRSISISNAEWKSSDDYVATVSNDGTVTAVNAGYCTITATITDNYGYQKQASCTVTVNAHDKEKVVLTNNMYLLVNDYVDGVRKSHVSPRIVTDPSDWENKCVLVTTNTNPDNSYDAQLFVIMRGSLEVGDVWDLSFRVKADYNQESQTESHSSPGEYISSRPVKSVSFETSWTTYTCSYTVSNTNFRVLAIDLSQLSGGNNCYFDDFILVNSRTGTTVSDEFEATGSHDSHDYVDLGLSVMWATCNVGAYYYYEPGDFYSWGETTVKHNYDWDHYIMRVDDYSYATTKYNTETSSYYYDNKTVLELEDDAANVNWGGDWRMPTKVELDELYTNCTWVLTKQNGMTGYLVTSNISGYTDRSIFIPAAGHREETSTYSGGCFYWSSTVYDELPHAWYLRYDENYRFSEPLLRQYGLSVRPVFSSDSWAEDLTVTLNLDNATINIGSHTYLTAILTKSTGEVSYPVTWSSSNSDIAYVNDEGVVTGMSEGMAIITATCLGKTSMCVFYVVDIPYSYVDLGLSVKWATCNIGAFNATDYGDYYAWGEISTKRTYTSSNSKWGYNNGWTQSYKKYHSGDEKLVLDDEDDAATRIWGENWRMPTSDEMDELLSSCSWEWTSVSGVNGYLIVSYYNGNSIFLPAAGRFYQSSVDKLDEAGRYATKSCSSSDYRSIGLYFDESQCYVSGYSREYGYSIRPVYKY